MIPLYLQRAQYFAERYFLFNISEGASVLGIRKSNVFFHSCSNEDIQSNLLQNLIFYTRMCKLAVL